MQDKRTVFSFCHPINANPGGNYLPRVELCGLAVLQAILKSNTAIGKYFATCCAIIRSALGWYDSRRIAEELLAAANSGVEQRHECQGNMGWQLGGSSGWALDRRNWNRVQSGGPEAKGTIVLGQQKSRNIP